MSRLLTRPLVDERDESSVNAIFILVVIGNVLEVILVLEFLAIVILVIASEMLVAMLIANYLSLNAFTRNPK
jgi:hypothetical protein